ncbi:MAG: hypothetical protein ACE5D0_07170 [Fidelibacterota bacterium]
MKHIPHDFLLLLLSGILLAQDTYPPPTNLVTIPTAGTLVRGSFAMKIHVQKNGGLTSGLKVGITDRFQFGLMFGASNLIGDDSLRWYPRPEVNLKYRLIDETTTMPGISLGLDTQGFGTFNEADSLKRYEIKAYGLFLSGSKNWTTPLGNMGIHGGMNYNFTEILDGDEDPSLFMGLDLEFNPELSLLFEYNAALNENDLRARDISLNRGGYLNAAVRWTFVEHLHIELDFNNLLFDKDRVNYFNRELKIIYIEYF